MAATSASSTAAAVAAALVAPTPIVDGDQHGPAFLKHGQTSQSLSLFDIFTLNDGSVIPLLKTTNPPVRANVLYISPKFSLPIVMFHASHHIQPVPATKEEIEAEASSVQAVARTLCPLKIVLDIVVLTSTGVLLSCWQENLVTERKEKSVSMNAFELISRSQSFNLDSFFEQQTSNCYNILCHSGRLTSCTPGIKVYGCISSLPADLAGSISSCRWSCCCWAGLSFGAKLFTRDVDVFHLIKNGILPPNSSMLWHLYLIVSTLVHLTLHI
ncbi:CBL-interacting protein kinase [Arachis hypogaea]|nr:CBL-interacting protein kinase [Arachis hypogaea]